MITRTANPTGQPSLVSRCYQNRAHHTANPTDPPGSSGLSEGVAWVVLALSGLGLAWPMITDQVSAQLVQVPLGDQLVTSPDLFARFEQHRTLFLRPISFFS